MKSIRMLKEFRDELTQAERNFPTFPNDIIHAAAIVQEEAGELMQAALQHTYECGSAMYVYKEAVQVGAMALRLLINFEHLIGRCSENCGSAEYSPQQPQPNSTSEFDAEVFK